MDDRQQRRIATNQSKARDANEMITRKLDEFRGTTDGHYEIMCECPLSECEDMFEVPTDEYRRVRSDPTRFAVLPQHMIDGVERVVEDKGPYWIVEKFGDVSVEVVTEQA